MSKHLLGFSLCFKYKYICTYFKLYEHQMQVSKQTNTVLKPSTLATKPRLPHGVQHCPSLSFQSTY